jgi:urea-proton symporter
MELFPVFDAWAGWSLLALYAGVALYLTNRFASGFATDKESFLLARRDLDAKQGSLSIAAAWLWAPGLFISAQQAYVNGVVGLFWFCLGNFITLGLFSVFAKRIRATQPDGFTMSGWIKQKFYGPSYWFYRVEMLLLAVCAFAINLIAGATTVELLFGISYNYITIAMAAVALLYAFRSGLKATVVTEIIKILVVWIGVLVLVPLVVYNSGGMDTVISGLGGRTGGGTSIIGTSFAWGVFTSFGITAFLGHLGGTWRDNSFFQRAFALKEGSIIPAFVGASFVFIVIPLSMGILGFVAAGSDMVIGDDFIGVTNAIVIAQFLPSPLVALFCFMVFAGLIAILDSQMASITNLIGNDFAQPDQAIERARYAMVLLALIGVVLANTGVTIQQLFIFFSLMGATLFIPSATAVFKPHFFTGNGLFIGLVLGLVSSMLIKYGWGMNFEATLMAVFGTPLICKLASSSETIENYG